MVVLRSKPKPRVLQIVIVGALLFGSPPGLHGQRHRALLSLDLQRFEARRAVKPARVIVNGSRADIDALAERHHLAVVRYLKDSAVVLANSAQATEPAHVAETLSGDLPVAPFMSVSNSSTAADQVRSGTPGLLLGIGGISGVTGQGITVAVVDSGISAHPALAQKVIANVSYVSGDPTVADSFGHGTHIAGIIAGNYYRTGIRLLSLLEAPLAWLTPGYLHWGDLNLIGLSNPLATTRPNEIIWGDVANWTSDHEIIWDDSVEADDPQ